MEKKKVILYGASENALLTHKLTMTRIGEREPVAFCDRDPHKQGKRFLGLPIVSFAEAKGLFGDFDIYVTANERHAPDIIGYLLENGVGHESIINFEPVEKRRGCVFLDAVLLLQFNGGFVSVKTCDCISEGGAARGRPGFNIEPSEFTPAAFGKAMAYMDGLADDIRDCRVPECCAACSFIKEQYFFATRKKRHVILGGNIACNYKCLHCTNAVLFEKYQSSVYDDINIAMDTIDASGVLHKDAVIAFSVGEFTIDNAHAAFLRKHARHPLVLYSNGYLYSEAVADALRQGCAELCVSIDAGTPETYRKIKGVDGFGQVCANIKRYSERGIVILKYIMFEGVNVNDADIGGFYSLADEAADMVLLSRDFYMEGTLSDYALEKSAEFIARYRNAGKLSRIVGFQRGDEDDRLQKMLEAIQNGEH
jgi:MoaA/NifB/PqqE/SkfB family radical SAM enzyme